MTIDETNWQIDKQKTTVSQVLRPKKPGLTTSPASWCPDPRLPSAFYYNVADKVKITNARRPQPRGPLRSRVTLTTLTSSKAKKELKVKRRSQV